MALVQDREVKFFATQEVLELPVRDNVTIVKGALVGLDPVTGYARPLVAGDAFAGVAYHRADNTGEEHADGAVRVRLHQAVDIVHALAGVTVGDISEDVYASDDGTLSLSASGNSRVGLVVAVEGTSLARVRCEPFAG